MSEVQSEQQTARDAEKAKWEKFVQARLQWKDAVKREEISALKMKDAATAIGEGYEDLTESGKNGDVNKARRIEAWAITCAFAWRSKDD